MLQFALLGSGSSGNALLIASSTTKILIDNGLSFKQLQLRAAAVGQTLEDVQGVFITHEHADHVNGVGVVARKLGIPIYVTERTLDGLPPSIGILPRVETFEAGDTISVNGLALTSFSVCHDAVDPISFIVQAGEVKLGIASDLGHVSQLVKTRLHGSHGLILESNYCPDMLQRGPYPIALKQRIHGSHGHLSNPDMNSLLANLLHDGLQVVVLAHISKENNTHDLAETMAARVLKDHGATLYVARQDEPTPLFEIRA